jgi:hypothetical protein
MNPDDVKDKGGVYTLFLIRLIISQLQGGYPKSVNTL